MWKAAGDSVRALNKRDDLQAKEERRVHDALYIACRGGIEHQVGEILESTAKRAGEPYQFKVPLIAEHHIGDTWADV